jgi:hypothetical protein
VPSLIQAVDAQIDITGRRLDAMGMLKGSTQRQRMATIPFQTSNITGKQEVTGVVPNSCLTLRMGQTKYPGTENTVTSPV